MLLQTCMTFLLLWIKDIFTNVHADLFCTIAVHGVNLQKCTINVVLYDMCNIFQVFWSHSIALCEELSKMLIIIHLSCSQFIWELQNHWVSELRSLFMNKLFRFLIESFRPSSFKKKKKERKLKWAIWELIKSSSLTHWLLSGLYELSYGKELCEFSSKILFFYCTQITTYGFGTRVGK